MLETAFTELHEQTESLFDAVENGETVLKSFNGNQASTGGRKYPYRFQTGATIKDCPYKNN